jgi:hypothetical protein
MPSSAGLGAKRGRSVGPEKSLAQLGHDCQQIDRYAAIMRDEAAQRKVASIAGIAKDQLRRAI